MFRSCLNAALFNAGRFAAVSEFLACLPYFVLNGKKPAVIFDSVSEGEVEPCAVFFFASWRAVPVA